MVKRLLNAGLIISGLISLIGGIIAIINLNSGEIKTSAMDTLNNMFNMATMGRVGAIICFAISLILVAVAFVTNESNKAPSFATAIFGTTAFVAQFLFNPITSISAYINAIIDGAAYIYDSADSYTEAAQRLLGSIKTQSNVGLVILIFSGLVLIVMGIVGLAKKDDMVFVGNNYNSNYNYNPTHNYANPNPNPNYANPNPNSNNADSDSDYDIRSDPDYNYKSPSNYNNTNNFNG